MKNLLPWLVLGFVTLGLVAYFMVIAKVQLGGDIVEYYGISESLLSHQGVHLTGDDRRVLEQFLHKGYFEDPGYYIPGKEGNRYPVHFVFYSFLVTAVRLLMKPFEAAELKSLWLVNIFSFSIAIGVIWKFFTKQLWQRMAILLLWLASPLLFFFVWPGPDMWYLMVLSVAVFAFFAGLPLVASLLTAVASWHSQPLLILSGMFFALHFFRNSTISYGKIRLNVAVKDILFAVVLGFLIAIPYLYNLYAFGVTTPWTILQDGWTKLRGFGLHNVSIKKLYEQFFDLNIGIFWYMPGLFVAGVVGWFLSFRKNFAITITPILLMITAFFYQTNPGWHYGTSGFGPGRHGIFAIPFVLYFVYILLKKVPEMVRWILLIVLVATQLPFLAMNNFLEPHLTNTLYHSPVAHYVLSNHPQWYNPTPEIFIDRSNHTDVTFPTSAFFKKDGKCAKAYVLNHEIGLIETTCGYTPEGINAIVDNPLKRIANYSRSVVTPEITFWPESDSCADWFTPTPEKPYVCMRTVQEVMQQTGVEDPNRITQLPEFPYPGIWKINYGEPVEVKIPAGYVVDHYSFEGEYVTFTQ